MTWLCFWVKHVSSYNCLFVKVQRRTQSLPVLTADQVLELIKVKISRNSICILPPYKGGKKKVYQVCQKAENVFWLLQTAPAQEVQKEVEGLLSRQDLQPLLGQIAAILVSRSLADPVFYCSNTLAQLVHTQCLCHRSVIRRVNQDVFFIKEKTYWSMWKTLGRLLLL